MADDLMARLGESIMWIDLRLKLILLLQKQINEGDEKAASQMGFLSQVWPGGGAPRQNDFRKMEQLAANLGDVIVQIFDGLATLGLLTRNIVEQAQTYGVEIPPHILENIK